MTQIPDAPDIRRTEQTGYPYAVRECSCERCGGDFWDDRYYFYDGKHICKDCFIEALTDDLRSDQEMFAEAFGIEYGEVRQ